jgi:hypothetical protein
LGGGTYTCQTLAVRLHNNFLDLHNFVNMTIKYMEIAFYELVLVRKVVSEFFGICNIIRRQFKDFLQSILLRILPFLNLLFWSYSLAA